MDDTFNRGNKEEEEKAKMMCKGLVCVARWKLTH